MARLKNRNHWPPGGWQFLQPQTKWSAPKNASFDVVVKALVAHRKANPFIVQQHGLHTDYEWVADEVDEYNAARCVAKGWTNFLSEVAPPKAWTPQRLNQSLGAAVAGVKKTAAGIKLIAEWLGSGLKPVDKELAEKRAAICVTCPKNDNDPNWLQSLGAAAAEEIKQKIGVKHDLELNTSHDLKLFTCNACDCYLPLKVWTPMKHILANTSDKTKAALDPRCWILKET